MINCLAFVLASIPRLVLSRLIRAVFRATVVNVDPPSIHGRDPAVTGAANAAGDDNVRHRTIAKGEAMSPKKALVIGGGIGGPVAAIALQRAGFEAVLYEARNKPGGDVGLFLNTASNGLDVLHTLDIDLPARADGFPIPCMVMWSGSGKRLGEVANGIRLADGTVSVAVKRGALQQVLHEEALNRGVKLDYGKRLLDYRLSDGKEVIARFADGTEAAGDLLVGADGLHSRTRQVMDPGAPTPVFTGLLSIGGYSHTDLEPTPETQHLVFGKRAFFGYLVRDAGEVWWFANLAQRDEPLRAELKSTSQEEWKRRLLELFAGDMPLIGKIIESTDSEIGAYPIHDLATIPKWHSGPVALVGDAAHATSPNAGQGASLAMEDALILAKSLRDIPSIEQALATYQTLRRDRAERVVAYSHRIGKSKAMSNPVAVWLRDLVMPFALKHFAKSEAHAWLYRYHIDWGERVAA
jgi:FAD-dependent urate hydroxylase